MNVAEDDGIKLQRSSVSLLSDLKSRLPRVLRRQPQGATPGRVHRWVRETDVDGIIRLVYRPLLAMPVYSSIA